ncbi:hypothetical protein EWH70_35190 [Amycolatopsis suaedae]|uniref:Glycoside hydrolase n=1 Tax=Amycolatopsis suaedae TaxID=2510978 RepID=A0A4Q7IYZ1_9PSEU|nr:hypothetical protein EWH70_35190 [Amycolatopsis suaedae]
MLSLVLLAALGPGVANAQRRPASDATFYNDARTPGADPFVRYDERSGFYYAYSTEGADPGYHFAIYRSPDLAVWEKVPGGALRDDGTQWAHDWFWAPEVYFNERTGVYFFFYSGRMNRNVAEHFKYANFEEPSKIGVAVSRSPEGPFRNITTAPIDYYPYDPDYHDVNLIMDSTQRKPPATLEEGRTAPLGTYIPYIDPNVFFDDDGRIYLYFSRNAYRNWVWDTDLGKYIEESNIYLVELTREWWDDPEGRTMPAIHPRYRDANRAPADPPGVRKDGFTPILNYGSDKQSWENAHVDDYARSGGQKKDRRWAEGSTTIRTTGKGGKPRYFLTYSANNYENEHYGVGYATADSPLGPWRKSTANPVLRQDPAQRLFSTGHGSIVDTPAGQRYYVHHGRPSTSDSRRIYTSPLSLDPRRDALDIHESTTDQPIPDGVAPLRLTPQRRWVEVPAGGAATVPVEVTSRAGATFDLTNPLNRLRAEVFPSWAGTAEVRGGEVVVRASHPGVAVLTMTYQRQRADGGYVDVSNLRPRRAPVAARVALYLR